ISPAQNIVATANANRDNVTITWEATPETDIEGYFVYRSHRKTGRYQLINSTPITELSLTDNDPYEGTNHYMVRVAKKQITGSGSYINLSLGINAEINAMVGDVAQVIAPLASDLAVYPTIAEGYIMIEQERNDNVAFQILNTLGTIISTGKTKGKNTRIDVSQLASGTYFVKAGSATYRFIKL
ncbi:MAG: T9SS type A sorting domain-containing protein, partial [Bacteroidia bacterium]